MQFTRLALSITLAPSNEQKFFSRDLMSFSAVSRQRDESIRQFFFKLQTNKFVRKNPFVSFKNFYKYVSIEIDLDNNQRIHLFEMYICRCGIQMPSADERASGGAVCTHL